MGASRNVCNFRGIGMHNFNLVFFFFERLFILSFPRTILKTILAVSHLIDQLYTWIDVPRPEKSREAVASALHPTLCAVYFCDDSGLLSSFDGNLLSYVKSIPFD